MSENFRKGPGYVEEIKSAFTKEEVLDSIASYYSRNKNASIHAKRAEEEAFNLGASMKEIDEAIKRGKSRYHPRPDQDSFRTVSMSTQPIDTATNSKLPLAAMWLAGAALGAVIVDVALRSQKKP